MHDINNVELKVGQIVRISGAYFANDDGFYYVEKVPGCPAWTGRDCCLKRICKNGKISTAAHNICFWPIAVFVNDRYKAAAANEHNKNNATIEIIYNINNEYVKKEFENACKTACENANYYSLRWSEEHPTTTQYKELASFYAGIVADLSAPAIPVETAKAAPTEPVSNTEIDAKVAAAKKEDLTIKLQGLKGNFKAVTATELNPGDVVIYNYGYKYTIISIDQQTDKTIVFTERSNTSGKIYTRRASKTTAFAIDTEAAKKALELPPVTVNEQQPEKEPEKATEATETAANEEKHTHEAAQAPTSPQEPGPGVSVVYYAINENMAKTANDINSFREYKPGTATNEYKAKINSLWGVVEEIKRKKPANVDKAVVLFNRYNKRYAQYLNDYYRNEAACPSVMICGPANFPTRKKAKQNSRRDSLLKEFNSLCDIERNIKHLLHYEAPIMAGDDDAVERLTAKIEALEARKELAKRINAYYRKYKTVEGFPEAIPEDLKKHIVFVISHNWTGGGLFDTTNMNQELQRLKARLETIKKAKSTETTEHTATNASGEKLFDVVQNKELMRLQLFFDGIPDENTRNILKSNGFKWAPSQKAWQRQLTENALYSLKRVEAALMA